MHHLAHPTHTSIPTQNPYNYLPSFCWIIPNIILHVWGQYSTFQTALLTESSIYIKLELTSCNFQIDSSSGFRVSQNAHHHLYSNLNQMHYLCNFWDSVAQHDDFPQVKQDRWTLVLAHVLQTKTATEHYRWTKAGIEQHPGVKHSLDKEMASQIIKKYGSPNWWIIQQSLSMPTIIIWEVSLLLARHICSLFRELGNPANPAFTTALDELFLTNYIVAERATHPITWSGNINTKQKHVLL